jgi:hypothetical protein
MEVADHDDPVPEECLEPDNDGFLSIEVLEVLISCCNSTIKTFSPTATLAKSDHHSESLMVMRKGLRPSWMHFRGALQQIS